MSHARERTDKICLNCNTEVQGRFCQHCGQENLEPHETFVGLVTHFFNDITHFDGKFFYTLKYLITRPGFLALEFIRGRRAAYLNPIRMYIFTSALFFLVFFSLYNAKEMEIGENEEQVIDINANVREAALAKATNSEDSAQINNAFNIIQKSDSADRTRNTNDKGDLSAFKTVTEYQNVQKDLPPDQRDGWLAGKINSRKIYLAEKYKGEDGRMLADIIDKFLHTFPYLLFVSLPLFALFLKMLYSRKFYFADHAIFLVYLYIFQFILLLIQFAFDKSYDFTDLKLFQFLRNNLVYIGLIYTIIAMKRFYQQSWAKTILKFLLFSFLAGILIFFLFAIFLIITVFQV